MMRRLVVSAVIVLAMLLPSACSMPSQSEGPSTWIDQPLDGAHFPVGMITLQAHASDKDGVTSIQFFVDGKLLQSSPASGQRLGEAMIEWTPTGPGTYLISASAVDGKGNAGDKTSVQITVGEVSLTGTPTPAGNITATFITTTPTPSLTPTATITSTPNKPSLTLTLNANCRSGPGQAYPIMDVFTQGQVLTLDGRNEDSSWLWVRGPGGSGHCWVSTSMGTASGNWSGLPLVAAPPLIMTETPLVDVTPPQISNVVVTPATIEKSGCGSPNTLTFSATVTDPSGVAYVNYHLLGPYPADTADGVLSPIGGDAYQVVIGPLTDTGAWLIYLTAGDTAANSASVGPSTFTVLCML
jgi:hypothetical protein